MSDACCEMSNCERAFRERSFVALFFASESGNIEMGVCGRVGDALSVVYVCTCVFVFLCFCVYVRVCVSLYRSHMRGCLVVGPKLPITTTIIVVYQQIQRERRCPGDFL